MTSAPCQWCYCPCQGLHGGLWPQGRFHFSPVTNTQSCRGVVQPQSRVGANQRELQHTKEGILSYVIQQRGKKIPTKLRGHTQTANLVDFLSQSSMNPQAPLGPGVSSCGAGLIPSLLRAVDTSMPGLSHLEEESSGSSKTIHDVLGESRVQFLWKCCLQSGLQIYLWIFLLGMRTHSHTRASQPLMCL